MSKGKRLGYIRVSTTDQNPERQLENIPLDKKFVDYASGKSTDRPQLQALLEFAREDDIIYVHSMDRLARKVKDILNLVEFFLNKDIQIKFVKENIEFTKKNDPMANCMLSIFGAVAELEYSFMRERQAEGIALAKKSGRYKGRKRALNSEKIEKLKHDLTLRKSKSKIAEELKISRFTLYKYEKEINQQKEKICN